MAFVGHRDLMRCFERLFRRAQMALSLSEGFHPHSRMSFPLALALGVDGQDEVMEIELSDDTIAGDEIMRRAAPLVPSGLTIRSARLLPEGSKKAKVTSVRYRIPLTADYHRQAVSRIGPLLEASTFPVLRPGKERPIDIRPTMDVLTAPDNALQVRLLRGGPLPDVGPRDILLAMELPEEAVAGRVVRTAVELGE